MKKDGTLHPCPPVCTSAHRTPGESPAATSGIPYAAMLTHEVNNHLNVVLLSLEVARHKAGAAPYDAAEVGRVLDDATRIVHETAAGLRGFLRAEQMRVNGRAASLEPVNLYEVVCRSLLQFTLAAARKGVTIRCDLPREVVVASNRDVLALALQNLIGNAVKYSSGGTIRIAARRLAARWELSVSDEGPGIAPDKLPHIFKPFRRGESHGQCGAGLGLAIAADAAGLVGANLSVRSQLGRGSTFYLAFPRDTQPSNPPDA